MATNVYEGLIAAVFSPMSADGSVNSQIVPRIVEHLIRTGVRGLYVCGTTGEGALLTSRERCDVAQAYVAEVGGRIPVIVQVGHDSLAEARQLAQHAQAIGANAIAAVPPVYFRPPSLDILVDCLSEISSAVPDMPFFFYHIPRLTGVSVDIFDLLSIARKRLPALAGIKYSAPTIDGLQACLHFEQGRYTILFGCDEMLLSALCVSAKGAVGSTYNLAPRLYLGIMEAFQCRDMNRAERLQELSVQMVRILYRYGGLSAIKATMGLLGLDCGPCRRPLQTLPGDQIEALGQDLERIGFFTWQEGENPPA